MARSVDSTQNYDQVAMVSWFSGDLAVKVQQVSILLRSREVRSMFKPDSRILLLGIFASLCFMGGIAKAASVIGIASILFPELAALSYDVFVRPCGYGRARH
ncbi:MULTISPECIES: hypothetical protein [unclassified Burkholderia]|uniref:hypothetical protein n=3 Tax=Burkholderiaceae TaxID=119060 RepID=UPI0015887DE9|nr:MULTISPECIES: hypothetical protein [unclassified Burkholderia]